MIVDSDLKKRLKKLDKKAQLLFYKQCFDILMSTSRRYVTNNDDAAIFVNEAFLKILSNIHKVDSNKPIDQWMRRITINCIIDAFRKKEKRNEVNIEDSNYEIPESTNTVDIKIEKEYIDEIINRLPEKTKLVLNLHYREGYPHKEIAKMLNISVETSKWHIKSARKQFKELKIKR